MKKNIKKIATMLVAMLMAVSMVVSAWADSPADDYEPVTVPRAPKKVVSATITVKVNGKTLSERGVVKNGRTFLPVATLGQSLGLATTWDQATKTVIVGEPGRTVEIKLGSKRVLVNGEVVVLDVPAFVLKGRTMLPVSFIAKYLGLGVSYDAKAKIVAIDSRQSNQQPPQPQDQTNPGPQQPSQSSKPDSSQPVSTREFVLEPLPELYPAIEYNDRAPGLELYPGLSIDVPYEEMARYGFYHGNIKKLNFNSPEADNVVTLRRFMQMYVVIAELQPNSDSRNIPVNIVENSSDGVLWKKAAKTGVFQFLINSNGKVNMDRVLTWPEVCHILVKHFEWMGVDPYGYENFAPLNIDLNGYNGPYVSDIYAVINVGYFIPFTEGGMNNRKLRDNIATRKIIRWELYHILEDASGAELIKR